MGKKNKFKKPYKNQEKISTDLEDRYFSKQGYGAALEEIGTIITSAYEKLPYFLNKCSDLLNAFGGVDGKEINKEYQALSNDGTQELGVNPESFDEEAYKKYLDANYDENCMRIVKHGWGFFPCSSDYDYY